MTKDFLGRKCLTCIPTDCSRHYLYVVYDYRRNAVKIGLSKNVSKRMAHYRANGNTHIEKQYKRFAGCWSSAIDRENKAIRMMEKAFNRIGGDWFDGDIATAIEFIEKVCASIKPEAT